MAAIGKPKRIIPNAVIGPLIGDLNAQPTLTAARKLLTEHVRHHRATFGATRGRGNPSRNPRMMASTAISTLTALNARAVVGACISPYDREQLAKTAMDAARQLKAIHDIALAANHRDGHAPTKAAR